MIATGADLDLGDKKGETPLMWAIVGGDANVDVVKDLLAHGANVFATNTDGGTAINYASSYPPTPEILELLKAAAQEQDNKGITP